MRTYLTLLMLTTAVSFALAQDPGMQAAQQAAQRRFDGDIFDAPRRCRAIRDRDNRDARRLRADTSYRITV